MNNNNLILTPQGKKKLEDELLALRTKRPLALEELQRARAMGDLKENSAYQAARSHLTDIDRHIIKRELMLRRSTVVEKQDIETIQIGSVVTVQNGSFEMIVTIVGESEADPKKKHISHGSPLAKALLGKKKGEQARLTTETTVIEYSIIDIT
ncbi:transcription elongation factor GreA [Candidatus Roizmanbacteria bacterium CG10_big_fil_rev_8_21_14_0_10_39_6]|uniref:Transcription elongation factor GreA n=1 Tax=Candidatus Roizmanbacteria bacterium CG10_big_fil_rev_8_21_14_0_10_39_6 TaxID=1974853 RepID=A0A2M8KR06_9BACT|nr:MAG: transcription elongation factor GreA [Candidatus Roizmanbacteria bacterium CG10_big_fil_rev_8_21_14_0_10_39_6]